MIYTIKEGDTFPPLRAYLQNADGSPIRIAGATVLFKVTDKNNNIVINTPVNVVDEEHGYVRYDWNLGEPLSVGVYTAEFEITFQNGTIVSVPSDGYIIINVVKQVG